MLVSEAFRVVKLGVRVGQLLEVAEMEREDGRRKSTAGEVLVLETVLLEGVTPAEDVETVDRQLDNAIHLQLHLSHVVHVIHIQERLNAEVLPALLKVALEFALGDFRNVAHH